NFLLLITSYLVFFIPARQLEVAVGLTVTSLLASIALQLTFQNALPEVGYLTKADKMSYLFYSLITFALVQTVVTFHLENKYKIELANRLEIMGRIFYPVILVFGLIAICLI
ncbi:MAG TPA: hypothetical protein VJY62_22680, partial [Bacteroidia bacterium]|nr:hypothetical protein [Bacteroidia bacterium]